MSVSLSAPPDELRELFAHLATPRDLAALLDVPYDRLVYHIYRVPESQRYLQFTIPKKGGGQRSISAPATSLKIIQRKLNQVLQSVYSPRAAVHGFVTARGILSNARRHRRQRYVLNIDLLGFFPSIHFGRVRGLFIAQPYNLPPPVATVIATICCFHGLLPQGAPTSPIISNMICATMDSQLLRFAQSCRCIYTRYADDITFSTSMPAFPAALARPVPGERATVGPDLLDIIQRNGFSVNPGKVRLRTRSRRQEVTGLTVNQFPNVSRRYARQLRAILHAWRKFGHDAALAHHLGSPSHSCRNPGKQAPTLARIVRGKIDFVGMVRGRTDPLYMSLVDQLRALAPEAAPAPSEAYAHLRRQFAEISELEDHHRRGYLLQDFLRRLFRAAQIDMTKPFTRNERAEQIDGAFVLDGWHYIVECRWREQPADTRELDGLQGQVARSGRQTMGLFISIGGWSENVPLLLKQNPEKVIILVGVDDVRGVVETRVPLLDLLQAKIAKLNLDAEPYYPIEQYLSDQAAEQLAASDPAGSR